MTKQRKPPLHNEPARYHREALADCAEARLARVAAEPDECSCRGEYVTALDIVDGCKCGRLKPFHEMTDDEVNAAASPATRERVTDEMVDRALSALMFDPEVPTGVRPHLLGGEVLVIRERCDAEPIVRATLEAALSEKGDE